MNPPSQASNANGESGAPDGTEPTTAPTRSPCSRPFKALPKVSPRDRRSSALSSRPGSPCRAWRRSCDFVSPLRVRVTTPATHSTVTLRHAAVANQLSRLAQSGAEAARAAPRAADGGRSGCRRTRASPAIVVDARPRSNRLACARCRAPTPRAAAPRQRSQPDSATRAATGPASSRRTGPVRRAK
jgi:hypothetical protein